MQGKVLRNFVAGGLSPRVGETFHTQDKALFDHLVEIGNVEPYKTKVLPPAENKKKESPASQPAQASPKKTRGRRRKSQTK